MFSFYDDIHGYSLSLKVIIEISPKYIYILVHAHSGDNLKEIFYLFKCVKICLAK